MRVSPISSESIIFLLRHLLVFMASEHGLFLISSIWTSNWASDYESYQRINLNKLAIKITLKWPHSPKIITTVKPCRMWSNPWQSLKHHHVEVKWGWWSSVAVWAHLCCVLLRAEQQTRHSQLINGAVWLSCVFCALWEQSGIWGCTAGV